MKKIVLIGFLILILGAVFVWVRFGSLPATVAPTPSPPVEVEAGPVTFTHPTYHYSLSLAADLMIDNDQSADIHIVRRTAPTEQRPQNFIYISVVTPENHEEVGAVYNYNHEDYHKLSELKVGGDSVVLGSADMSEGFTYTYLGEAVIAGHTARIYENTQPWEFPAGTVETRYTFEDNETVYVLGYYTGGVGVGEAAIEPDLAQAVVTSFKLTP